MSTTLGMRLKIRSMVHMAAESIPFFWPMRTFIHHNPLHGLEHLPFPEAVEEGGQLLHGKGFLPRHISQEYLAAGKIDEGALAAEVATLLEECPHIKHIDRGRWLLAMLTGISQPCPAPALAEPDDIHAVLHGTEPDTAKTVDMEQVENQLRRFLLGDCPVYEAIDALYGSRIGEELDTLLIKSCLNFFDEGQSAWEMPGREQGFYHAWRELALHNIPLLKRTRQIHHILGKADTPEGIIAYVMEQLEIPEADWIACFTRELVRLHGWVGFIRWRSRAKHYYWSKKYPGDLIDFMAIRLTLAWALVSSDRQHRLGSRSALVAMITERPQETWLRFNMHSGRLLATMARRVERALLRNKPEEIAAIFATYMREKRHHEARQQADQLQTLAHLTGEQAALDALTIEDVQPLLKALSTCEQHEGMMWLRALETQAMNHLLDGITLHTPTHTGKRPFAQALFCIDNRSERIRRHLESMGDYQTFGIASPAFSASRSVS